MRQETLNLNKIIFGMSQRFNIKHSTSKIFNLYTRELERASEVISSLMLAVNAFLQIIIFVAIPIYLNTKFTIIHYSNGDTKGANRGMDVLMLSIGFDI